MSRFQIPTRLRPIPALMLALLTQPNLAGVAPTDADEMLSNASIADMTDSEPSASERGTSSDPGPAPPALMLAQVYAPGIDVSGYWVSEKLDGVRAYWDGTRLVSRGGHGIRAPAWFIAGFPSEPLDGESSLDGSWTLRRAFGDSAPAGAGRRCLAGGALPGLRPARAPEAFRGAAGPAWGIGAGSEQPTACPRRAVRVQDTAALTARLDAVVALGRRGPDAPRGRIPLPRGSLAGSR